MSTGPPVVIGRVRAVLIGSIAPCMRAGAHSAIAKQPVDGRCVAGPLGLAGDAQADTRVHGGPDKAIHFYAFEHYDAWRRELGERDVLAAPGAFGENLSTEGVDEHRLCLGDHLRIGEALLEVSQGRQPCWKLNDRFGAPDMARRMQGTLRTGGYTRVLASGSLGAGDDIVLVARPYPEWSIARLMDILYARCLDPQMLRSLLELPLVPSWRKLVERRLDTGEIEDWQKRLEGPQ